MTGNCRGYEQTFEWGEDWDCVRLACPPLDMARAGHALRECSEHGRGPDLSTCEPRGEREINQREGFFSPPDVDG